MTDRNDKSLGKRLRFWRKLIGKTQTEFSEYSNVSVSIIRNCELDNTIPSGQTLISFANTGLNIHWLLTGIGEAACSEDAITRPYIEKLTELGIAMAALSDNDCDDVITEMSLKVKNYIQLQKMERLIDVVRKRTDSSKDD